MNKLIDKINELYGFRLRYLEKVEKGFLSENHILSEGGKKYFLKKYRFDNEKKIREIHSVKNCFSSGGVSIILPLVNKKGNTFFFFENGYFSLFPFVYGKSLERANFTDATISSFGETLGHIHRVGEKAHLKGLGMFHPWKKENALETIELLETEIVKKTALDPFDKMAKEGLLRKKKIISENVTSFDEIGLLSDHLIHGDYLDHNVFFGEDGCVSHVFDLEKADYSPRMYELWRSLMYVFLEGKVGKEEYRKAKLYLDSYLNVYPAEREELEKGLNLFYAKMIHGLWVESEHYLKNNKRVDCFLAPDFERVEYLFENFEELKKELI